MRKLLRYAMLWHRFLGIATCLFFGIWFASGIVMMYARMPELREADRLNHLPALNLALLRLSPQQALGSEVAYQRIVVGMLGQRPVYRALRQDGTWSAVFADDGRPIGAVTRERALNVVADFSHSSQAHFHGVHELTDVDQWTVYLASRPFLPFEVFASDDDAGNPSLLCGKAGRLYCKSAIDENVLAFSSMATASTLHQIQPTITTKHPMLGQISVCNGCCCGQTHKGHPEVPVEWLKQEWRHRGLLKRVHLSISGCLGPCDVPNVVLVTSGEGTQWLARISTRRQYQMLADWAAQLKAADRLLPLPREFDAHRLAAFRDERGSSGGAQ